MLHSHECNGCNDNNEDENRDPIVAGFPDEEHRGKGNGAFQFVLVRGHVKGGGELVGVLDEFTPALYNSIPVATTGHPEARRMLGCARKMRTKIENAHDATEK